jgi:hypothetical protein
VSKSGRSCAGTKHLPGELDFLGKSLESVVQAPASGWSVFNFALMSFRRPKSHVMAFAAHQQCFQ